MLVNIKLNKLTTTIRHMETHFDSIQKININENRTARKELRYAHFYFYVWQSRVQR